MCIVTYFKHLECNHIWAVVTEPCLPYMGFTNCPTFTAGGSSFKGSVVVHPITGQLVGASNIRGGRIKAKPKFYKTRTRLCPKCDLGGVCDANVTRMVADMGWGFTLGKDVAGEQGNWGVDFRLGSSRKGCVIL
ncbi:hypothetical protein NQ176_g10088 [Zarea fungicola]|uniref:Uncharacterized protein n=1 Tax=Zarea fungicola TaxID=93591 RepID=A0ACC1MIM3_9HYPO|nr:hypothetical protein NQ176_g10088 [Lecanicillium fungicola]